MTSDPPPTRSTVRVAGLLYLLQGALFAFSFQYVLPALIAPGNAAATADNVMASETLFRIAIVCELVSAVVEIFTVRVLYRLLSGVNKAQASLMVTFVLVSVPISFLNVLNEAAVLMLLDGGSLSSAFGRPQLDSMVMMFLSLHEYGIVIVAIFWGLWLFPLGALVYRSGFFPRVIGVFLIGVFLIVACFAYIMQSLVYLLLPPYVNVVDTVATLLEGLGEGSTIVWLLAKGARVRPSVVVPAALVMDQT